MGDILDIEQLRKIPITKLYGVRPKGRVQHVKCPFHGEKTPSLALYPNNSFHCFGCGAHGNNAIDFVMKMGCNFKEACQELQKLL